MTRYKMVGRDLQSFPLQYRTWVVNDFPDINGVQYHGSKSGDAPLDAIFAYEINNESIDPDFNLPNPEVWNVVETTLPQSIYNSQLAVIDGYVYLFGSQSSNKIFRAHINRPSDWVDTHVTLPSVLSSSQLAIVGDTIYLFGGNSGQPTDHIYSAPVSNPLSWTDHGALLPDRLQYSQLAIIGDMLYLFGGKVYDDISIDNFANSFSLATNNIYAANLSSPLSWSLVGHLPDPVYGSQLCLHDGYVYLLGGLFYEDNQTSNIYKAPMSNPTSWSISGSLPYACGRGQFFTLGEQGYLIGPSVSPAEEGSFSRILRCNLSDPSTWEDTHNKLPGTITSSQLAIIDDRPFVFGGNGSSMIFAMEYFIKYDFNGSAALTYSHITRTLVDNTTEDSELFAVLGFPYWKTNYRRIY